MGSGKAGWTFNAAGLNAGTVEKYGGKILGSTDNIQAYRVEGELLTKIQEVNKNRIIMDADTYLPIGDMYKDTFKQYLEAKFLGK